MVCTSNCFKILILKKVVLKILIPYPYMKGPLLHPFLHSHKDKHVLKTNLNVRYLTETFFAETKNDLDVFL